MTLVVLDRDGVINADSDHYIRSAQEFHFLDGSLEAIVKFTEAGWTIAVATNQSGIGRGLFKVEQLAAIHRKLIRAVEDRGGRIDGIFYCPHRPEDRCACRKPATGLLTTLEERLAAGAAPKKYLIGDKISDLLAAERAGYRPVLVMTGKGRQTAQALAGCERAGDVLYCENLLAAAEAILDGESRPGTGDAAPKTP